MKKLCHVEISVGYVWALRVRYFVFFWIAAGQLSRAALSTIGTSPSSAPFEAVSFEPVQGWYLPASDNNNCILLLHGVRSDRREMVGRAIFFRNEGYPSLAIDLQAHGETPGNEITFGYKEAESAQQGVTFLRTAKGCKNVIVLGNSLGGAAALLGAKPLNVDGYILEGVYSNIERAVKNRLNIRVGALGDYIAPLLYIQIPLRLGIDLTELQPAEAIRNVKAPVLILNGTEDHRTTKEDALMLFENAPEPKTLVWINGAGHTNLFEFNRSIYGKAVLNFLSEIGHAKVAPH